jgi:pyrroline-5-carboxylate reductase
MRIAILGAGKIGEALLAGLIKAGHSPADLCISEQYEKRAAEVSERYGVAGLSLAEAAGADVVVIAVKPPDVAGVARTIASTNGLVISVAAGVTTAAIEREMAAGARVVRVMPNTPMLVGEGMSAISAGTAATPADLETAQEVMGAVGAVVQLPEAQLDAVTALSGSGPAYVFLLAEALIDAGVLVGLARPIATQLAVQTLVGSALMLRDSGDSPTDLLAAVTSPGGTTAAGLQALESHALRGAVADALKAARDRSLELGA